MKNVPKGILFLVLMAIALAPGPVMAALGPHDTYGSTTGGEGACAECHNTAAAAGTRGWGKTTGTALPSTIWAAQAITPLCWSCHSPGGGVSASDTTNNAMLDGNHGPLLSKAPPRPGVDTGSTAYDNASVTASNLPYTKATAGNLQCTSCHNVHNSAVRPFNVKSSMGALCDSCHVGRRLSVVGGANTQAAPSGGHAFSTHPVGVLITDIGSNGPTLFQGTINTELTHTVPAAGTQYVLGGKLTSTNSGDLTASQVDCQTCHAVHGPGSGTTGNDLLAINNYNDTPSTDNNALCIGCHQGGKGGGTVAGKSDHPMDNVAGRAFYPTGAAIPTAWSTAGGRIDRGAALFTATTSGKPRCSTCHDAHGGKTVTSILKADTAGGVVANSADGGGATNGEWCWSCHSIAGVIPNLHHSTKSTAGAANSSVDCGNCHASTASTQVAWNAHQGFGDFAVAPEASDATPNAAGNLNTLAANAATYERLCELCHDPKNPTIANTNIPAAVGVTAGNVFPSLPARHGITTGTMTHLTSNFNNASGAPAYPVRDHNRTERSYLRSGTSNDNSWGQVAANAGSYTTQYIRSKYANWGAGNTPQNPASIVDGAYVVCESCHNLLTNAGTPVVQTPADLTAGYKANLLVKLYEDDGQGGTYAVTSPATSGTAVGDGFCRGCHSSAFILPADLNDATTASTYVHYPEVHTMKTYGTSPYAYLLPPYGRTSTSIMFAQAAAKASCPESTTADAPGPGLFTYIGGGASTATAMNCDSCHRPHNAATLGGNGVSVQTSPDTAEYYILEPGTVTTDNLAKTQSCTQCHANRATGQWWCFTP